MKHVDLNATINGLTGITDPTPYLDLLPDLAIALPVGARAFATNVDHYDFVGKRCVKDLQLTRSTDPPRASSRFSSGTTAGSMRKTSSSATKASRTSPSKNSQTTRRCRGRSSSTRSFRIPTDAPTSSPSDRAP
ncbi:hypothetical protein ACFQHO_00690 [Actinomadura yumaensis]|uniref:hypothetical protein n=1 Tax=Actinomadura yumaensis TaxID=111807 RepID=UPI00360889C5